MIYVVYGSQTGNAEEIAKMISKETQEKFKNSKVEFLVMNKFLNLVQKFPEKKENKNIVIAVCSTTGAGDPPTNCENFVRWIKRKTLASDTLSNVFYTVLGLGDSNYTKYQHVPRLVDEGLSKIGAKKFYARGEADDAYGLEIVVEPWMGNLYPSLEKLLNEIEMAKEDVDIISTSSNVSVSLSEDQSSAQHEEAKQISSRKPSEQFECPDTPPSLSLFENNDGRTNKFFNAKIFSKNILSGPKSERTIFSLKINPDESHRDLDFSSQTPGSYLAILPSEGEERIKKIKSVMNIQEKSLVINKNNNFNLYSDFYEKYPHFKKLLVKGFLLDEEVINYIVDFDSILKKSHTDSLRQFLKNKVPNLEVLEKFDILFTRYTEMILRNRISLFDVLSSLSNYNIILNVTISEVLEYFPVKYPRKYSLISFNYEKDVNPLEIVFTLVNDRIIRKFPNIKSQNLPLGIKPGEFYYRGQSTNFLKSLKANEEIFITEVGNCFEFPIYDFLNKRKPIVYICNGTGVSPCISFIKLLLQLTNKIDPDTIGELIILTGFRSASHETKETVYEEFINDSIEFLKEQTGKDVINYLRCLSTCSENEEEEVGIWRNCRINTKYVQDLIVEHDEKIHTALFKQNGYLMVCGDVEKLYDECISNVTNILINKNRFKREACVKYIEDMKVTGRLIIEKWM